MRTHSDITPVRDRKWGQIWIEEKDRSEGKKNPLIFVLAADSAEERPARG